MNVASGNVAGLRAGSDKEHVGSAWHELHDLAWRGHGVA
jgi:hypothetical protein